VNAGDFSGLQVFGARA